MRISRVDGKVEFEFDGWDVYVGAGIVLIAWLIVTAK